MVDGALLGFCQLPLPVGGSGFWKTVVEWSPAGVSVPEGPADPPGAAGDAPEAPAAYWPGR